jgi:hypothetical protein
VEKTGEAARSEAPAHATGGPPSEGGQASATRKETKKSGSEAFSGNEAFSPVDRKATSSPSLSIEGAEVAALRRWIARVWPGIPLDGGGIELGAWGVALGADLFRPLVADATELLPPVSLVAQVTDDAPLATRPATAEASKSPVLSSPPASVDGDGKKIVYFAAFAALLALLLSTVGAEFRSAFRARLR